MAELAPWKAIVDEQGKRLVGVSNVQLKKSDCSQGECNIGSLITDSFVHAVSLTITNFLPISFQFLSHFRYFIHFHVSSFQYVNKAEPGSWTYASIALTNNGGIRTDLAKGSEWQFVYVPIEIFIHLTASYYHST